MTRLGNRNAASGVLPLAHCSTPTQDPRHIGRFFQHRVFCFIRTKILPGNRRSKCFSSFCQNKINIAFFQCSGGTTLEWLGCNDGGLDFWKSWLAPLSVCQNMIKCRCRAMQGFKLPMYNIIRSCNSMYVYFVWNLDNIELHWWVKPNAF